jgi:hypothetical protein
LLAFLFRARPGGKPGDLFPELGWDGGCNPPRNLLDRAFQKLKQDLEVIIHRRERKMDRKISRAGGFHFAFEQKNEGRRLEPERPPRCFDLSFLDS